MYVHIYYRNIKYWSIWCVNYIPESSQPMKNSDSSKFESLELYYILKALNWKEIYDKHFELYEFCAYSFGYNDGFRSIFGAFWNAMSGVSRRYSGSVWQRRCVINPIISSCPLSEDKLATTHKIPESNKTTLHINCKEYEENSPHQIRCRLLAWQIPT